MLTTYPAATAALSDAARTPSWVDMLDPTEADKAWVEEKYGFRIPSRRELSEIESSSRVSEENGVLYLSMPIVAYADALDQAPSPLGFVLSKDVLVTIRYTPLRSFDAVVAKLSKNGSPRSGLVVFATIIDEMVDLMADLLEPSAPSSTKYRAISFRGAARGAASSISPTRLCAAYSRMSATSASGPRAFATYSWACSASFPSWKRRRGPGFRRRSSNVSKPRRRTSYR